MEKNKSKWVIVISNHNGSILNFFFQNKCFYTDGFRPKIQQEYEELCGGQVLVMEREFESGKRN